VKEVGGQQPRGRRLEERAPFAIVGGSSRCGTEALLPQHPSDGGRADPVTETPARRPPYLDRALTELIRPRGPHAPTLDQRVSRPTRGMARHYARASHAGSTNTLSISGLEILRSCSEPASGCMTNTKEREGKLASEGGPLKASAKRLLESALAGEITDLSRLREARWGRDWPGNALEALRAESESDALSQLDTRIGGLDQDLPTAAYPATGNSLRDPTTQSALGLFQLVQPAAGSLEPALVAGEDVRVHGPAGGLARTRIQPPSSTTSSMTSGDRPENAALTRRSTSSMDHRDAS